MQQRQVLAYNLEGRALELLRELAGTERLWVRELRHCEACRTALRAGQASLLILRLGREIERELALLAEAGAFFPDTAVVALGDAENQPLAALAWDLGAAAVLFPPLLIDRLPEVVRGLLQSQSATPTSRES